MPYPRTFLSAAALLTLLACQSEPRAPTPPAFAEAFSNLPLPPRPELVSRSGSADALQLTLHTPVEPDRVADYYRQALTQGKWRLVSDTKSADGSTALYAEHDGPPLWVRIWSTKDRPGTMVQLTGAVVAQDSTKTRKPSDSSVSGSTSPRS